MIFNYFLHLILLWIAVILTDMDSPGVYKAWYYPCMILAVPKSSESSTVKRPSAFLFIVAEVMWLWRKISDSQHSLVFVGVKVGVQTRR